MSRLATSFVLGYHGCDKAVGMAVLRGDLGLIWSDQDYDWLGPGAYFWEADPLRALEWAKWKFDKGKYEEPFVIGAVIDLRNCLDLVSREDLQILRSAYDSFVALRTAARLPMPQNKSAPGRPDADRVLRYLDCAVIKHLHSVMEYGAAKPGSPEQYETVRGMFVEGGELYPDGGFRDRAHIQIAVRTADCIKGFFVPRPYPGLST